jgi:hypothetical protein
MGLIEMLNDLKNALSKSSINKEQFIAKLSDALTRANNLFSYLDDIETFDDVVTLISYQTADGDTDLATLVSHLIFAYVNVARDLSEVYRTYLKEMIAFYLQK